MKIEVYSQELKRALNVVLKGVSPRPHLPILLGVLIRVKDGKTSFTTTDLENSFWVEVETAITQEGETVVPAKLFYDLVSTIEDGRVLLEYEDSKLKLTAKGLKTEVLCLSPEEYPVVPKYSGKGVILPSLLFKKTIDKVIGSSAKDDTRPILTGILFKFNSGFLTLVTTDGFRLATNKMSIDSKEDNFDVIVPAKSIGELLKVLTELAVDKFGMELDRQSKQIVFSLKTAEMSCRILDGEFPPYQQIIPNTYSLKISLHKQDLVMAVKRASLFAKDNANVIRVKIDDKVLISAENSQVGSNITEVEAEIEGEKMEVAFNAKYLIDFLPVIESEYVDWETEGELKPSVFRDSKDDNWLQVVMPIRTQS